MHVTELYLDLDGVFADFNARVIELSGGKSPDEMHKSKMWSIVHSDPTFFLNLPFTPGAKALWEGITSFSASANITPIFLTGAPSSDSFRLQKKEWVAAKFGEQFKTIVLPRREKQNYSKRGAVLIDDNKELIEAWRHKGGIGLLYKDDPADILSSLYSAHVTGYHPYWEEA